MKSKLLNVAKLLLSLGFGVFIIWWFTRKFTPEQWQSMKLSFMQANYFWVAVSALCGIAAHLLRAWRWQQMLEPMGYKPKFSSTFYAVMFMYFFNLVLFRIGEIMRCTFMARYEKIPFEKSVGTMLTERLTDTLCMLLIGLFTFLLQIHTISSYFTAEILPSIRNKMGWQNAMILLAALAIILALLYIVFYRNKNSDSKLMQRVHRFKEGLLSIRNVKNKPLFFFNTAMIWVMYILIIYTGFHCLPATSSLDYKACLAAFFFGSIGIIAVQGGLGAYPAAIAACLTIYGIATENGFAFGWIMWTAQNVVIVLLGLFSLAMFMRVKVSEDATAV